jgi:hypothetical protein
MKPCAHLATNEAMDKKDVLGTLIVEILRHGDDDRTPITYISRKRLAYYRELEDLYDRLVQEKEGQPGKG